MTVKEAIEQGYTHYFIVGEGFQPMNTLAGIVPRHLNEAAWDGSIKYELVQKEPVKASVPDVDEILDLIANQADGNGFPGDDTGNIYEAVMAMDKSLLTPFMEKLKETIEAIPYYKGTGIMLTN